LYRRFIRVSRDFPQTEGGAPPEPYINYLNESALQALNLGGAVNSDELRGHSEGIGEAHFSLSRIVEEKKDVLSEERP
jgi:hypothetical protein